MNVRTCLDELRSEPERLRGRVRILEAAGVGDERDVQRLCDLRRHVDAELGEEVAEDLARRGRVRDDEVEVPEARVVVVMVDVDHVLHAGQQPGVVTEPALVGAVDREQRPLAPVGRQLAPEPAEVHERVLRRQRRVAVEVHDAVLADLVEGELRREDRSERVPVRVLVRDQEKAVA